jgi:hypothetical protein
MSMVGEKKGRERVLTLTSEELSRICEHQRDGSKREHERSSSDKHTMVSTVIFFLQTVV